MQPAIPDPRPRDSRRAVETPSVPADLIHVSGSLHRQFDARLGAPAVDIEVLRIADQFTGARIRAFVPLFVRRFAGQALAGRTKRLVVGAPIDGERPSR